MRRLSGGGFSEIFEVEDPASALPERLILKRLNAEMSARPAVRAAFSDEAKILRELKHPNIVTFRRCYFDETQRVCLLMEKVEGEALDAWARKRQAQPEVVLDLFAKVLEAVDYLHHRAVPFLHLDLKPDNILVAPSAEGPQPVLIDFGIARRSGGQGLKAFTPPYGAPEQEAGGALDCSTDVYALGQILTELLDLVQTLDPRKRPALAAVVARSTQPRPRQRYADAGQMKIELRRACRITAPPAAAKISLPAPLRQPRWAFLSLAGLVLLATLGAWWVFRSPATPAEAGPADATAAEAAAVATRDRFAALVAQAQEATREGHFDVADRDFVEAKTLCGSVPPQSETAREMMQDLDELRNQIDLARYGGP